MSKEKQAKFMDGEKGLISYNNVIYIYIYMCVTFIHYAAC